MKRRGGLHTAKKSLTWPMPTQFGIISEHSFSIDSMQHSPAVEHCIEAICGKGCRQVWGQIAVLERGEQLPETEGLSREETAVVLAELKTIMAVYGDSCSID